MPSSRPNGRRRIEHRRIAHREARSARRARRFALLVLLAAVFVVALALTAFGGQRGQPVPLASSSLTSAQARPSPEIVALRGPVRLQLPIAQGRVTAIGYSAASGALPLSPVGHQANEGIVSRVVHGIFGGGGGDPRWYQLGGGGTNALDVGAAGRDGRLRAGRRDRRRDPSVHRHGQAVRLGDRHPAAELAVRSSSR